LTHAYGAPIVKFNLFKNREFDLDAFKSRLEEGGVGKKVLLLNFPNNPSGYSPTVDEANAIVGIIKESAEKGNKLVVINDDAYFGLVYEEGIITESLFAALSNVHENVLAIKVDGPTKEDYVWGFRVGFITYGIKNGSPEMYSALESKTAGAIRGNISNAANISQSLLLAAYNSPEYASQKETKFSIMKARFEAVKETLTDEKYKSCFTALPFNSGYFMCIKLAEGIDGEKIRHLLIKNYSIGIINLNNIIRIAYSSVAVADMKKLFDGIYDACNESRG
jgi:aspartate/methionine/tyrosine aminotransferase